MAADLCPQCGSPRAPGVRYCGNCAFDFAKPAEAAPPPGAVPPAAAVPPPDAPKRRWGWKRIALVVAAVVVVLAVVSNLNSDPGDAEPSEVAATETESSAPSEPPPSATPVPTPEPTPAPAFADIALSGTGDSVPQFSIPEDAAAIAVVTHTGSSNFAIFTVGADGTQYDLLVNEIGNYAGTVLFDESSTHSVAFEITADGPWTITIKPVTAARVWDGTSALNGSGDDVVRVTPQIDGLAPANVQHTGSSNFAIIAYSSAGGELLVNEIGAYSGEILLGAGTFLVEVTADGAWTIAPS